MIDNFSIELIIAFWVCQYSALRIWAESDTPSCVLRIDGGLSPLGNLEADDTIHGSRQELTVDTYKITDYCSP